MVIFLTDSTKSTLRDSNISPVFIFENLVLAACSVTLDFFWAQEIHPLEIINYGFSPGVTANIICLIKHTNASFS